MQNNNLLSNAELALKNRVEKSLQDFCLLHFGKKYNFKLLVVENHKSFVLADFSTHHTEDTFKVDGFKDYR